jgi:hypothetical protein
MSFLLLVGRLKIEGLTPRKAKREARAILWARAKREKWERASQLAEWPDSEMEFTSGKVNSCRQGKTGRPPAELQIT